MLGSVAARTVSTGPKTAAGTRTEEKEHADENDDDHDDHADRRDDGRAAIAVPAPAQGSFQSPSGDITCLLGTDTPSGKAIADCEIADHIWVAPPRSPDCPLNWGSRFRLEQGSAAGFACYHQELPSPQQTLDYGQMQSVGVITCDSEPAGMTCTDSSTGHFFRVSRESYQLG